MRSTGSSTLSTRLSLLAAAALLAPAAWAGPAAALTADPSASRLSLQVPALAGDATGSAPLDGRWAGPGSSCHLQAAADRFSTGRFFYDILLRPILAGTAGLTLPAGALGPAWRVSEATLTAYGRVQRVPVRAIARPLGGNRYALSAHLSVPLSAYNVVSPSGGSAGAARIALEARFVP